MWRALEIQGFLGKGLFRLSVQIRQTALKADTIKAVYMPRSTLPKNSTAVIEYVDY